MIAVDALAEDSGAVFGDDRAELEFRGKGEEVVLLSAAGPGGAEGVAGDREARGAGLAAGAIGMDGEATVAED